MTYNECKFCFYLFCNYYDGKTIQDIPNMEGMSQGIKIVKIDASKIRIEKCKHNTSFNSPRSIFWFPSNCYNEFRLNYLHNYKGERKFYFSVEDFLYYFKIPFKDIV